MSETPDSLYLDRLATTSFHAFVVKVDVETAEPAVLRGARTILLRHRPFVICEVLADHEAGIMEALDDAGYAMYRYAGGEWLREARLVGDRSYRFRDWLFVPAEQAPELGESFEVPEHAALTLLFG